MASFTNLTLKDHIRESIVFNRRLMTITLLSACVIVVLISRMFYLQIINNDHYTTLSENNRVTVQPIPATRGLIYDRNGILLAQNIPGFSLQIIPERSKNIKQTITALEKLVSISKEDKKRFYRKLRKQRSFLGIPIRYHLTDQERAQVAVNLHKLAGVEIHAELIRHYPLKDLASHAVGYVSSISEKELKKVDVTNYTNNSRYGKIGIEKAYEKILHGKMGVQRVESNAYGRVIRVLDQTLPVPGKNIYLNLDIRLHKVAKEAFNGRKGAVVAINPDNGAVLALASFPAFDPNLFVNVQDTREYRSLETSPAQPFFNRAIRGRYPPGSTIKPFIGLAGLETYITSENEIVNCKGSYQPKNDPRKYRDWKKHGHGKTDLEKSIVESCDVYYYILAEKLKIDRITSYLAPFGFGAKTNIDLRGERAGLLPSRQWKLKERRLPWFPGETLISGIGQGFNLITPVQLASSTATLSVKGQRQQPRMVYATEDPDIAIKEVMPPRALAPISIVDEQHWDKVNKSMENVVHSIYGTARSIRPGIKYKMAAKTGTAQVFGIAEDEEYEEDKVSHKLRDHALFIAFAPAEKPEIALAIIVENGGHGGSAAGPIARKIIDTYLLPMAKIHAAQ